MYLYNANENKIDVFKFEPIEDMIKEYRVQEMRKIPEDERVFRAITNSVAVPLDSKNLLSGQTVTNEEINYKTKTIRYGGFFHEIEKYPDSSHYGYYSILEHYYSTGCLYGRLIRVINNNETNYYLLTHDHYTMYHKIKDGREMESIINIPEKLRVLYYLENGLYDYVKDLNIEEQAALFTLSKEPIMSINRDKLILLQNSGLIKEVASENEIANNSQMVKRLQRIYK